MIRKIIWALLISVFFIGFVLTTDGSARPGDRINATAWIETCSRVSPSSQVSYENADETVGNADDGIGQNIYWMPAEKDKNNNGIIRRPNFLIPKIKGINRK